VLDDSNNLGVRGLADFDSRLTNLNKHVAELEEAIESRPRPPSTPPGNMVEGVPPSEDYERLNRKVDRAYKWQEGAEKTLRDMNTKLQPLHGEVCLYSMDHLRNRLNFDLNKSRQKFHHSLKEHHNISNIPKFRCEML
jgi:hypothetical protein